MAILLTLPLVAGALLLGAGRLGLLAGRAPADLGVVDGRLKAPSKTANSVSSQAALWPDHPQQQAAAIAPLALLRGSGPQTLARLADRVRETPGGAVVTARDDYLHATFTTAGLRFVDDAEFWVDPAAGVVQVRSASRLGRRDFGVNRARVEDLRARLAGG